MKKSDKMKKILVIFGTVLMLVVLMCGCTDNITGGLSSEEQRFVGRWKTGIADSIFRDDGTCTFGGSEYTFKVEEGALVLTGEITFIYDYVFSDNDNIVALTQNDYTQTLVRQ